MTEINILPHEIEIQSFSIIDKELSDLGIVLDNQNADVIKRTIHTSADFDYAKNLVFSQNAVSIGVEAIKNGASIVTDTQMARSGINKLCLSQFGGDVFCFMSDADIAEKAKEMDITRAAASMEKAAKLNKPIIFAIGNAPTALMTLCELIEQSIVSPKLVIGVPVGFVNVIESKEKLLSTKVPYIAAMGRKGGSSISAAICNALLYKACGRQ